MKRLALVLALVSLTTACGVKLTGAPGTGSNSVESVSATDLQGNYGMFSGNYSGTCTFDMGGQSYSNCTTNVSLTSTPNEIKMTVNYNAGSSYSPASTSFDFALFPDVANNTNTIMLNGQVVGHAGTKAFVANMPYQYVQFKMLSATQVQIVVRGNSPATSAGTQYLYTATLNQ